MPTPTHLIRAVGRRICTLRELRGLTQRQLSERAGVGYAELSKIENGQRAASLITLDAIARGLQSSLTVLLDHELPLDLPRYRGCLEPAPRGRARPARRGDPRDQRHPDRSLRDAVGGQMTSDTDTDALKVRVGARLRALRRARDLSQRDVASLLNTDAAEVSRHESGARCPSVPLLARYAEVLEVPIYELLRFDEPVVTLG
ncbi:MAG: transcriptional regulator [Deltaproteobacteria bacterium]|nr:transcriptional regulator [Deltaproteobacteria bacterium]